MRGTFMDKLVIYFSSEDPDTEMPQMEAIVHVILDQDLPVIKFDVDL